MLKSKKKKQKPQHDQINKPPKQACTSRVVQNVQTIATSEERSVLMVSGLPPDFSKIEMVEFFMNYGEVTNCKMKISPEYGLHNNYAFVEFKKPYVGKSIIERNIMCRYFKVNITLEYIEPTQQNPYMFLPPDNPKCCVKSIVKRKKHYFQTELDQGDEIEFAATK